MGGDPPLHSPETPARGADAKREAVLGAALALFSERGFHGTPMPLVARQAGVGTGTIYRYFESKEALVNALYQRYKASLAQALVEHIPPEAPPREQFHRFWQQATAWARAHPDAIRFLELHHHGPYLDDASWVLEERVLGTALELLQQAARKQAVKSTSPKLLVALVWGAFAGMIKAHGDGRLELDPETVDEAERCCWEAIRA